MANTIQKESKIIYLQIGQNYENLGVQKQFDVSEWTAEFPDAHIYLLFKRPGEEAAAPVNTTLDEDGILTWTVSNWETGIIGIGFAEIRAIDSSTGLVKKSHVIPCSIEASVTDEDAAPDYPSWVDRMLRFGENVDSIYATLPHELEEGIASIQQEAQTQTEAIEQKGITTRASIPADYTALSDDVTNLKSVLSEIDITTTKFVIGEDHTPLLTYNKYWNIEGTEAVLTSISSAFSANEEPVSVNPGEIWRVSGIQGTTHKARLWTIVDENNTILSTAKDYYDLDEHCSIFVVPSNGKYLLITHKCLSGVLCCVEKIKNATEIISDSIKNGFAKFRLSKYHYATFWNLEGDTAVLTDISSGFSTFDAIDVEEGEIYRIGAVQGNTLKTRVWAITDDQLTILAKGTNHSGTTFNEDIFVVPRGGTKLLITFYQSPPTNERVSLSQVVPNVLWTEQSLGDEEKAQARDNIFAASRADVSMYANYDDYSFTGGYFWSVETDVATLTAISSAYWNASTIIQVESGEQWRVSAYQGPTHKARIWAVTDDNMTILSMATDYYGSVDLKTEEFIIPPRGTKLVITTRSDLGYPISRVFKAEKIIDTFANASKILRGKTVAIIGDSISTNGNSGTDRNVPEIIIQEEDVGIQLSAYLTYYDVQGGLVLGGHAFTDNEIGTEVTFTPTAEDVGKSIGLPNNYNPNSRAVWWEVAQSELGFTTIPVCWSGSSITSHEAGTQNFAICAHAWHPSQIRKCGIRTPGTMNRVAPDMIIIYRGTNDFSHSPYAILTDNYFDDVNWEYPTDDTVPGGYGYLEGLALTISKLREAYPNTQIYLCTLNVFKRINYSHFPTNNGLNTLPEYNDAIRKAADFFGCGLIEFDKDGITFENCYSGGYITDSATIPTHPSDKGHGVMGRKAISDIKAQYNKL